MTSSAVRRYVVPAGIAALVLAVVLSVMRLVDPPGAGVGGGTVGGGEPPVLHLASWAGAERGAADPRYHLATELPEERTSAPVHTVAEDPDADWAALSAAVGHEVRPGPGGSWNVAQDVVVSSDGMTSTVEVDPPLGAARDRARSLLRAAGLDPSAATESAAAGQVTLSVEPEVDGRPTTGFTTTVSATAEGVQWAQGWASRTREGPTYPVVSAREAWDVLVRSPLPMPLMACPEPVPDTMDPVTCGGPVTVTGAQLGLSLQWQGEEPLLVPAWLFAVQGSPTPLAQVAVDPAFLGEPEPATGGGSGGSGGSVGSGTVTPEPGTDPAPDQPQSRFTTVTRSGDDLSLEVTFWGGVEACYAYEVRAREGAEVVELTLEERSRGAQACIEIAEEHTRTVELAEPLGVRRVVDAVTGETLLGPTR